MADKTILVVGTYDTKDDELLYMADRIRAQGGGVLTMDVSVLGDPSQPTDISKHDVAEAGGSSIAAAIAAGDENTAMQIMARGAAAQAAKLWAEGRFDGVVVLGGSMGTDLALDLCSALPLGVPKYIVSTVAFSTLIPAERLPADIQMILWAGGLYGLNSVCKSSLSQAAGAVLGAARAVEAPDRSKPLIGMTSLGKSALRYMVYLKPELEARGYEVAVFHATGMGGRAFESLAAQGAFAAVFDFCTQELGNHTHGSDVTAGSDRLTNAGRAGIPQLVSTGCYDLVDLAGWRGIPEKWTDLPSHAHNRLITSVVLDAEGVRAVARAHGRALAEARGETVLLLPLGGCGEWDRPGADLHNPEGLAAFCEEMRVSCPANVRLEEIDAHINDEAFATRALEIFDGWRVRGLA
ncbi:Tm-1-like ATP-binding domain-containing protein [Nioella ostreopsis]|uniref:Tm-1-like ATP-binding domain-containing protein n=1 Tax=Nioella ostreopsis TaxID=2448479 RepID=UPI000FDCD1AF|nr:Tm-1-like ATP-binding domain-containing protein [Nioella ostreopsis]